MGAAIVFDHVDVYDMGAKVREKGEPRKAPTSSYNFADQASRNDFERSWLQGWDSHDDVPPWMKCAGCGDKDDNLSPEGYCEICRQSCPASG